MRALNLTLLAVLVALRLVAPRLLLLLVVLAVVVAFLPMVALGVIGALLWRRLGAGRPLGRRWHLLLGLVAGAAYVAGWRLLGADPLLLYLMAHLSLVGAVVLALLGHPAWSLWHPMVYLAALPALPAGALAAGAVLQRWHRLWLRAPSLGVREARGLEIPAGVARRAAGGLAPPANGWALGYRADGRAVLIGDAESRHHVLICGAPGAGKTTVMRLILEGVAGRCPAMVIDCKASDDLRRAVAAVGGVVWTIGGRLRWDALRGDPTSLAEKLLVAESYSAEASIYRAAAERYIQWVGAVLEVAGYPREPRLVQELLSPPALLREIRRQRTRLGAGAPPALDQIARAVQGLGGTEAEGVAGFESRLGAFVEGAAGPSLGTGPGALVLEDAVREGRTVLFSLDVASYEQVARKVGAWVLLDLVRVAGRLLGERWGTAHQAYVLVDEFGGLGAEGRHIVPVLARGREAGFACVLATQGLADLRAVSLAVEQQAVQNAAVKILLRQGSFDDAQRWARHLGQFEREELSRQVDERGRSAGRHHARWRSEFYVAPETLRVLATGEAVLATAPIGRAGRRLEGVRVASPRLLPGGRAHGRAD
jgi:TraM recognition site of TraD and TraG